MSKDTMKQASHIYISLLWRSTGVGTLPSAYTGITAPPYIVLHLSFRASDTLRFIVLHGQSGVMKHTPYGFILPL